MKVPLIAESNTNTVSILDRTARVVAWHNGKRKGYKSPYVPYYYERAPDGDKYYVIGNEKPTILKKVYLKEHNNITIPRGSIIDGGYSEDFLERISIEHPKFWYKFPCKEPLRTLGIDIETYGVEGIFPEGPRWPIISIGCITDSGEKIIFSAEKTHEAYNDKEAIRAFFKFYEKYDPDIIYGHNLIGYDIPQIFHRATLFMDRSDLLSILNRGNKNQTGWDISNESKRERFIMKAEGRVIIDTLKWAKKDYSLSGKTRGLKAVAQTFGYNPKELDMSKGTCIYSLEEINDYLESDLFHTQIVFKHYFKLIRDIAEEVGIPMELYANGANQLLTRILQGRELFKQKILCPTKNLDRHPTIFKEQDEFGRMILKENKSVYQGARIALFRPGFHKQTFKTDFSSMYPSIGIALNLGPDTTRIIGYEPYIMDSFNVKHIDDKMVISIPDDVVNKNVIIEIDFSRDSCLRTMFKTFIKKRIEYKKKQNTDKSAKSRSDALKIIANTFYGSNMNAYITYGDMAVGLAITGVARWLINSTIDIMRQKYGEDSVIYVHTDGINTDREINIDDVNNTLNRLFCLEFNMDGNLPVENKFINVELEKYKESFYIEIGNYVLTKLDGSLTKHGSTFKSSTRCPFYIDTLNKIIEARLNNQLNDEIINSFYALDQYKLEDFLQQRSMKKNIKDYSNPNEMIAVLARQGIEIGFEANRGNTYHYYKTNDGYKIRQRVKYKDDLDIYYYWKMVSDLLKKFDLARYVRVKPPLTMVDKKQQTLVEFI